MTPDDDDIRQRVETLENAVRRLLTKVSELEKDGAPRARAAGDPGLGRPAGPRPVPEVGAVPPLPTRASGRAAGPGVEELVGRYGAMGLAALAIVSAVGIFLRWAIERGLMGPEVRVGAGLIAAAALAGVGWRFRARGARVFGNTLLGIALALVHVVAWAAGPLLGVVPLPVALGVAAVASIALAGLAWRTGEQSLFVVGTGGALLAPFVATAGRGSGVALLVYGFIVLTAGLRGIRDRPWQIARWLLGAGAFVYAGAAMTAAWSLGGTWGREGPALFAVACAWGSLALGGPLHGRPLVRAYLTAALPPLYYVFGQAALFATHVAVAAIATATLWASIHLRDEEGTHWVVAGCLLPLAFLSAALFPLSEVFSPVGALVALAWGAGALAAGQLAPGARREVHWTVAVLCIGIALLLWLYGRETELIWSLSALAAVGSIAMRRERAPLLIGPIVLSVAGATLLTWTEFGVRAPYAYTPFFTRASLAALPVVAGWWVVGWALATTRWPAGAIGRRERTILGAIGWIAAFLWVRAELAEAFSSDIATFLLIAYFAVSGVMAIFVGRRRQLNDLRRVGLALSIYGALKAVLQAYGLAPIGLRIGSFLLVGLFLLAVAYWYRDAEGVHADSRQRA